MNVFFTTPDGDVKLMRHCDGIFTLEFKGMEVMPQSTFEAANNYLWAEFMPVDYLGNNPQP